MANDVWCVVNNQLFELLNIYKPLIIGRSYLQDSLMCLPLKVSQLLGNINQLVLCHRITSSVQLVDPQSTQSEHY